MIDFDSNILVNLKLHLDILIKIILILILKSITHLKL